jgi:uncharacterized protein (TIGR02246 family)
MHSASHAVGLLICFGCAAAPAPPSGLSSLDSAAIRAAEAAYVSAWLADDTSGVLATFAPDAVILPPRSEPRVGTEAIQAHWWPEDGSRTRITSFEWTIEEIGGEPPLAYTRGMSTVRWIYDRDTTHQVAGARSPNLTILRRDAEGNWKITHQTWGPPLP